MTSKLVTQGYRFYKLSKKFFMSYSDLLFTFGEISYQEYVSEEIYYPIFYDDLVSRKRRVKCAVNFVLSCSKIVKRNGRRQYDLVAFEKT